MFQDLVQLANRNSQLQQHETPIISRNIVLSSRPYRLARHRLCIRKHYQVSHQWTCDFTQQSVAITAGAKAQVAKNAALSTLLWLEPDTMADADRRRRGASRRATVAPEPASISSLAPEPAASSELDADDEDDLAAPLLRKRARTVMALLVNGASSNSALLSTGTDRKAGSSAGEQQPATTANRRPKTAEGVKTKQDEDAEMEVFMKSAINADDVGSEDEDEKDDDDDISEDQALVSADGLHTPPAASVRGSGKFVISKGADSDDDDESEEGADDGGAGRVELMRRVKQQERDAKDRVMAVLLICIFCKVKSQDGMYNNLIFLSPTDLVESPWMNVFFNIQ